MQQNSASSAFLPLLKRKYEVTTPSETTKRIKFTITSSTSSEAPLPSLDRTTSGSTISSPKSFASSPALTAYSHSPMMKGNSFNKNFLRDSGFNPSPELTPLDESETTDLYTDGTELLARQAIRTAFQSNSLSPYEVKLVLGWGGNGCILAGTRRADHKPIAIKIIYKRGKPAITPIIDLPSEITVLKQLKHKNIISLLDWFEDKNAYFIVTERVHSNWSYSSVSSDEIDPNDECISVKTLVGYKRLPIRSGASDLFSYIDLNNSVPKHNQLLIFSQIVKAVEYMHRNHFTHGDIKEENILLSDDLKVKLCDYGHSRKRQQLPRGGFINRVAFYGTKDMTSPELIPNLKNKNDTSLLERVSGFECDVWALGLLLLAMISGTLSSSHKEFLANVSSGRTFTEYPANYRDIEENDCAEVADLLKKMLNCDPNERIKMKQVIDHPWIKKASLL